MEDYMLRLVAHETKDVDNMYQPYGYCFQKLYIIVYHPFGKIFKLASYKYGLVNKTKSIYAKKALAVPAS